MFKVENYSPFTRKCEHKSAITQTGGPAMLASPIIVRAKSLGADNRCKDGRKNMKLHAFIQRNILDSSSFWNNMCSFNDNRNKSNLILMSGNMMSNKSTCGADVRSWVYSCVIRIRSNSAEEQYLGPLAPACIHRLIGVSHTVTHAPLCHPG